MQVPAIKGTYYVNGIRAIRELHGDDVLQRVRRHLSPDAQRMIDAPPAASEWISLQTRMEIFTRIIEVELNLAPEQVVAVGRNAYTGSFSTVYKTFIKLFSPDFVVSRARTVWSASMQRCGSITEMSKGDKHVELLYDQMPYMRPWYWHYTRGGLLAIAELTRVKEPSVSIERGGGAANHCVFRIAWR